MTDKKIGRIICVGVNTQNDIDKSFYIITADNRTLRTSGELSEETAKLIRYLQAEVMLLK
jgi:hypothetical protein